jgi:hypothetical protein
MSAAANMPPVAVAAGGAAVLALAWVYLNKRQGQSLAGAAGSAAVEAVADAGAGAVIGLGEVFGIPATEASQCERDRAAGDTWAASFSCPASTFIKDLFSWGDDTTPANTGGATGQW